MLHRAFPALGSASAHNPFSDVSLQTHPWSYHAILRLADAGVISGYGDGTFRPEQPVTRAETASLLVRLADKSGL